MKINGGSETRGVRANGPKRSAGGAKSAGFANHLDQSSGTTPTEIATGPGGVATLLAAQAAGDALEGRRRARERAENLLDRLDAVRVALLEGRMDNDALTRLAAEMERRLATVDDPALAEVIAQVELRAQVELAKRGLI